MPFRKLVILAGIAAATVVPGAVRADTPAEARTAIQTAYNQMNAAAARKDVTAMFSHVAPDAQFVDDKTKKTTTAAQLKQQMGQIIASASSISAVTKVNAVALKGNEAIVASHDHTSIKLTNPQNHAVMTLVDDSTSRDTWVKTGGKWLLKRSEILVSHQTLNGKAAQGGA